jgi:hypothetical protein
MDEDDGQLLAQICSERASGDRRFEIAVGGGDDAEIHFAP